MARLSRTEKKEETRLALIHSAASSFARSGFEGSSIDTIAEDAGYSRGAFYSNFSSKDSIFLELLSMHLEAELTTLHKLIVKVETADELVQKMQHRYRNLGRDSDYCLLYSEFQLYVMRGGRESDSCKKMFAAYRRRLSKIISECCERLDLELKISPYEFAASQLAIAHGLALQRVSDVSIRASLASEAMAIFMQGAISTKDCSEGN